MWVPFHKERVDVLLVSCKGMIQIRNGASVSARRKGKSFKPLLGNRNIKMSISGELQGLPLFCIHVSAV